MKTEGLTFTEAVQALEDGYCEGIQTKNGANFSLNKVGVLSYFGTIDSGVKLQLSSFLDREWKLIGVKQKFVIEGVGWGKNGNGIDGIIYPASHTDGLDWSKFLNKPGMKMTLEWPE